MHSKCNILWPHQCLAFDVRSGSSLLPITLFGVQTLTKRVFVNCCDVPLAQSRYHCHGEVPTPSSWWTDELIRISWVALEGMVVATDYGASTSIRTLPLEQKVVVWMRYAVQKSFSAGQTVFHTCAGTFANVKAGMLLPWRHHFPVRAWYLLI